MPEEHKMDNNHFSWPNKQCNIVWQMVYKIFHEFTRK